MLLNRTVACFKLVFAVGTDEDARHHRKASARGCNHVAHHISVVILARPEHSALAFHNAGNCIVNQRIKIFKSRIFEFRLVLVVKNPLENRLKIAVIGFAYRIFCAEPYRNAAVKRIRKAAAGKVFY